MTFRKPKINTPISPPPSGSHNGDFGPTREYISAFISNRHVNQNQGYYQNRYNQHNVQPLRHHFSAPETYFQKDYVTTNEVVFEVVQEPEGTYKPVEIMLVDYSDPMYNLS